MKSLFSKVFNNSMMKGFTLLFGGTIISQFFSFAISPILTRLYNPTEYGINSIFTSLLLISSVFATMRLQVPITIENNKKEQSNLLIIGSIISTITSIAILIIVLLFSDNLKVLFDVEETGWLYVLGISTFLIGIYELLYNNVLGNRDYKSISIVAVLKVVFQGIFQIILAFSSLGYLGLVLGNLFSYIVVDLMLIKRNIKHFEKTDLSSKKLTMQKFSDYPQFAFPAELLGMSSREAITIILTYLFSPAVSGLYALANKLIGVPINLVANSLRQVYVKEASIEFNETGTIRKSFKNSSLALFGLSLPICLVIYIVGPIFFTIAFGEAWAEAGYYLRALTLYFFTRFTIVPLMASMYIIGKTKFEIVSNALVLAILILCTILTLFFEINNPIVFLTLYSVGYTLAYVIIYLKMWINIRNL